MKEEFLHYVWKTKNFNFKNLLTTKGKPVDVIAFGNWNQNAGPDFNQGKILLDQKTWIGHIEMHLKSSDWYYHKHHLDAKYQNVILHVVWEADEDIFLKDGSSLPCIELKELVSKHLYQNYLLLSEQNTWVPCAYYLQSTTLDSFYFQRFKMYIEKLEKKYIRIRELYNSMNQNWEQVFFVLLARSMGGKVNADVMEELARRTPLKYLQKSVFQPIQLKALLFGQAGLLHNQLNDEYPRRLHSEYSFLKAKYKLKSLSGIEWKLLRMRPCSFPTIRIAQLARLILNKPDLHHLLVNAETIEEMLALLSSQADTYWNSHYLFDKKSEKYETKTLSKELKFAIITNAIIPYFFARGKTKKDTKWIDCALQLIEKLPPEQNSIIRNWKKLGIDVYSRLDSQSLIHLYQHYCKYKKCLSCQYGNQLVKSMNSTVFEPFGEANFSVMTKVSASLT